MLTALAVASLFLDKFSDNVVSLPVHRAAVGVSIRQLQSKALGVYGQDTVHSPW